MSERATEPASLPIRPAPPEENHEPGASGPFDDLDRLVRLLSTESSPARRRAVARLRVQIARGDYRAPVEDLVTRLLPVVLGEVGHADGEDAQSPPFVYWPGS